MAMWVWLRARFLPWIRCFGLALALALGVTASLAACSAPQVGVKFLPPGDTMVALPTATRTPGPSWTPIPTLCARARVAGQTCAARVDVTLSSCCPEWSAVTTADDLGAFAFANITAGEYTVTAAGRSRTIRLNQCDSQVSVDLCPPPTPLPASR